MFALFSNDAFLNLFIKAVLFAEKPLVPKIVFCSLVDATKLVNVCFAILGSPKALASAKPNK
jgi:hypothetical protein